MSVATRIDPALGSTWLSRVPPGPARAQAVDDHLRALAEYHPRLLAEAVGEFAELTPGRPRAETARVVVPLLLAQRRPIESITDLVVADSQAAEARDYREAWAQSVWLLAVRDEARARPIVERLLTEGIAADWLGGTLVRSPALVALCGPHIRHEAGSQRMATGGIEFMAPDRPREALRRFEALLGAEGDLSRANDSPYVDSAALALVKALAPNDLTAALGLCRRLDRTTRGYEAYMAVARAVRDNQLQLQSVITQMRNFYSETLGPAILLDRYDRGAALGWADAAARDTQQQGTWFPGSLRAVCIGYFEPNQARCWAEQLRADEECAARFDTGAERRDRRSGQRRGEVTMMATVDSDATWSLATDGMDTADANSLLVAAVNELAEYCP